MQFCRTTPWTILAAALFLLAALLNPRSAFGQEGPESDEQVFTLGEIVVPGYRDSDIAGIGGSVIRLRDLRALDAHSLDEAANLASGTVSHLDSNGRRNESDFFVRGFGRWQVPLSIDGVRIYLPADNRLDYSRFLTGNLSAIQIQKGYASVLDGPGGMGGAINLVTRKPVRPYELEAGVGTGGRVDFEEMSAFARLGTRRERFYAQGSVTYIDRDSWTMSSDYTPPAGSLEDGDVRLGSGAQDWGVNAKVGFTPNGNDEYALNYMRQEGEKSGMLNVNPNVPTPRFWDWPWWNVQSAAFLSRTGLGTPSYLESKLYYNTFENALYSWDDLAHTAQTFGFAFRSLYEDHAYGASVELGTEALPQQTTRVAFHYRNDVHVEWSHNRPDHPTQAFLEPEQEQAQYTWSAALENTFHASETLDLVAGVSVEKYEITKAEDLDDDDNIYEFPKGGSDALNWQAAAIWRNATAGRLHASVSNRSRFPVIFELYSTRFGTATPNPDLGPERATNVELGWSRSFSSGTDVTAAVFYSDVRDLIQTVVLPDATTQTQNVGDGRFVGFEVSTTVQLTPELRAGGNYTFIDREIEDALPEDERPAGVPPLQPTGVPAHRGFVQLTWSATSALEITPSLELASDRWSDLGTAPATPFPYVETGAYTLANLMAHYQVTEQIDVTVGAKNLLDQNYEISWGLPQPGLSFVARLGVTF